MFFMSYERLKSVLFNNSFDLPSILLNDKKTFLFHFNHKMNHFFDLLSLIPERSLPNNVSKKDYLKKIGLVTTGIKETLQEYLNGYPAKSYSLFKKVIDEAELDNLLENIKKIELARNSKFYRIKREYHQNKRPFLGKPNGIYDYKSPLDLFHVPFEKRKAIPTNRFSIPGFPALYLSGSLCTSWSECNLKNSDSFHAIKYSNHRPLYIADVVPLTKIISKSSLSHKNKIHLYNSYYDPDLLLYDYSLLFPLILACHSKFIYSEEYKGEVAFKSEYIIPQLLLQWYREKNIFVDGIRYFSCTSDLKFPKKPIDKFNYVIPVVDTSENGYCNCLKNNFSASSIFSYLSNPKTNNIENYLSSIERKLNFSCSQPLK